MRENERQISGRGKREVEKTATVACNGSFLSGVVQVGGEERGSVGWFSVHAPTTRHPPMPRGCEDLLYEYCGSVRVSFRSGCSFVSQSAYSLFSNFVSMHDTCRFLPSPQRKSRLAIDIFFPN